MALSARRRVALALACCACCVEALVAPGVLVPRCAATARRHGRALSSVKEEEVVGVDMWGEPVTAADMEPVDAAPVEAPPPQEAPPKLYTVDDFKGSEWKIGILWREAKDVEVTWFRCLDTGKSQWGFGTDAEGKWKLSDGLFLTVSREFFLGWGGRRLFSARVGDDPNYIEGLVRGWKPWEPASVMGRFQAFRLGVPRANTAPWLLREEPPPEEAYGGEEAASAESSATTTALGEEGDGEVASAPQNQDEDEKKIARAPPGDHDDDDASELTAPLPPKPLELVAESS